MGEDTLGSVGPGLPIEPAPRHPSNRHSEVGGQFDDFVEEGAVVGRVTYPQVSDGAPARRQELPNSPAALDLLAAETSGVVSRTIGVDSTSYSTPTAGGDQA